MATRLSLYNGALRLLGQRALADLNEEVEARRLLDAEWTSGLIEACLSAAQWRFATRTSKLAPSTNIEPDFGYRFAYPKPEDHVRTTGVYSDEHQHNPHLAYRYEAGYWFSDLEPIYVSYVSNAPAYGGDPAQWPKNFEKFVEAKLAEGIALALTGDDRKEQTAFQRARMRFLEAAATDAMESPTRPMPSGSWVRVRTGGRRSNDRGSRQRLVG